MTSHENAERVRIRLGQPAEEFDDSFLLGNGSLGAAAYGRVGTEYLDLNLDTLWSGGPLHEPRLSRSFRVSPIRDALRQGDPQRAEILAKGLQSTTWTQAYQPLGRLIWAYAPGSHADDYYRQLDLAHAVMTTSFDGHRVDSFVSAPAQVLVMDWVGPVGWLAAPVMECPHPCQKKRWREGAGTGGAATGETAWLSITGRAPADVVPPYVTFDRPVRYDSHGPDDDGLVDAGMAFAVAIATQRTPEGARLIMAGQTGFRGWNQRPIGDPEPLLAEAIARVNAALARSTGELADEHVHDYTSYWDRCQLDLSQSPDATTAEQLFGLGRYLLISSSRPGTQAATLQGIWNNQIRPPWSSNYTTNINTEMCYWAAEPTGLGDCAEPLITLTDELSQAGETTAHQVYGFHGSCAHHNTDIWRFSQPVSGEPRWSNWPSALYWLSAHVFDHALFSGDDAAALPIYRRVVRFALDHLTWDNDHRLSTSPSTSPENRYLARDGRPVALAIGASLDRELINELFEHYLALLPRTTGTNDEEANGAESEGAKPGGPEPEDRELARRVRICQTQLAEIPTADGAITEWAPGLVSEDLGHRHLSHLYGIYPGRSITRRRNPELFEAGRKAARIRIASGSGGTGWSQAWIIGIAARLGERRWAQQALDRLTSEYCSASLLDLHPDPDAPGGAVFQIDGNLGAPAAMTELIVTGVDGVISLLPCLPASWPSGAASGIRLPGGHVVDLKWAQHDLVSAVIHPGFDTELVCEADQGHFEITDHHGNRVPFGKVASSRHYRNLLSFHVSSSTSYHITHSWRALRASKQALEHGIHVSTDYGSGATMTLTGIQRVD